jgi:cell division GTPase FtsZ
MSAVSNKIIELKEEIMDDLSKDNNEKIQPSMDDDKLAKLKAKLADKNKENNMGDSSLKKDRSINFGIVGSGQAGSRIAETFRQLGYDAICLNTAQTDLSHINIPASNKLLLDYGIAGAAKQLELGKQAAEQYRTQISDLVNKQLADAQVLILAHSLGGGSGAGSCETLVDILSKTGKPIMVITVLPMESEDAQTKSNALQTLAKLAGFAKQKIVNNIMVVDNARIELIYKDVSQMDFFKVANKAIVDPLHMLNVLSSMPSASKPLDPAELSLLMLSGEGLSVYGELSISNYKEDTAIASAIIDNMDNNLLASGFDLKQSKYVGVMIAANANTWKDIPAVNINYALSVVNDFCANPVGVYKGLYEVEMPDGIVKVYSMFSGLGLPSSRVEQLKNDSQALMQASKTKDEQRNLTLNLDTGKESTVSELQKIKDKIAAKSSGLGKLLNNNIVDRRK